MKTLRLLLFLLLVVPVVTSCADDSPDLTGIAEFSFTNIPQRELYLAIVSYNNGAEVLVFQGQIVNKSESYSVRLNIGDYYVRPHTVNGAIPYPNTGFQVQAGRKTKVHFDKSNSGVITYE